MTTQANLKIASIGESLLELVNTHNQEFQMNFSGDAANIAVYLARYADDLNAKIDLVTAVGNDDYSLDMLNYWQSEHVGTQFIPQLRDHQTGLYLLNPNTSPIKSSYYRQNTAVAEFFQVPDHMDCVNAIIEYDYIFFSGQFVSLLNQLDREALLHLLHDAHNKNAKIIFDPNYREVDWANKRQAQEFLQRLLVHTDIVITGYDEEAALFNDSSPIATAQRIHEWGVEEVVVKCGGKQCVVSTENKEDRIPLTNVENIVNTAGAGEAFNAGYIAARINQIKPHAAVLYGHKLASQALLQHGAMIERDNMPALFKSTTPKTTEF
tara:strand:- start:112228 stop:113196 length:969 start_codon:yes stop_codon:yes gene_type:complete